MAITPSLESILAVTTRQVLDPSVEIFLTSKKMAHHGTPNWARSNAIANGSPYRSLYIQALAAMQNANFSDPLSYFQVAGQSILPYQSA